MMTKQSRHRAGRTHAAGPDAGLPGPGQALIGYPEPQSSLFGVPLSTTSLFGVPQQAAPEDRSSWTPTPPRPRTPQDDYLRTRAQLPAVPTPRRPRQWPQLLGFPLAVLVLGVSLGVIVVVMLLAAGVPAPWTTTSGFTASHPSSTPGQSTLPAAPVSIPRSSPVATTITENGTYLVGSQLRAGRYHSDGGVSCYWARLRNVAGAPTVVVEGNGTGPTTIWIRKADSAFRTSGCTTWSRG